MKTFEYNDGLRPGGRRPTLWIIKGGKIYTFNGSSVPGVVVITNSSYSKNGKWSSTTYQLAISDDAGYLHILSPLHGKYWSMGTFEEGLQHVRERTEQDVSAEEFRSAMERNFPSVLERWDEAQGLLSTL